MMSDSEERPRGTTAVRDSEGLSNEDTLSLISNLLDSKLDSKFEEFKRKFSQQESASQSEIKKLKLETKAVSSFKHKGNRLQYEFNVNLLGVIEQASFNLLEGNLSVVNSSLESAKSLLQKRVKSIRFADKSPAGWTAVEEYESDDLADDSEDEKKLRSAEKRALSKIKTKKQW